MTDEEVEELKDGVYHTTKTCFESHEIFCKGFCRSSRLSGWWRDYAFTGKDGGTFKGIIQINGLKRSELLFKVPGEFLE